MENNIIKLTNKEYRFDIDCNVTKLTINVDDNSAIIVKGYEFQFHKGTIRTH